MSKLNTPEHEAYRAKMLAYGQDGDDPRTLRAELDDLRAQNAELEKMFQEADAAAWECERRHGGAA